ncbi:MAG: glutamate 5-kinase, partial [Deltaproteobacteria bacterium]|nr:glutamate 5-kinase [Deltaproteobacteria bacterium]
MGKQIGIEKGLYYRQTLFDQARRIVIKVGSAILTGEDGMNLLFVENLARGIAFLQDSGREVILVTSGAVSAGRRKINNTHENLTIKEKQALAAIGQSCLMNHYDIAFHGCGRNIGQILLTHSD